MNAALFAKSLQTPLPAGDCLVFHWLGQHSWLIRTRSAVVGLDLYLTPAPKRLVPPLFAPEQAGWLDMILCSHEHSDHYDRPSLPALFAAAPRAHVVVPEVLLEETRALAGATAPRVHGMRGDDELQVGDIRVRAVPAAHEFLDITVQYSVHVAGLKAGTKVLHHSVRMQYVRPNLAAPLYLLFLRMLFFGLCSLLLKHTVV